ncbi:MAG: hypothetical protein ACRES9_08945, partial [Gammaproteobacteria bacterium]
MSVDASCFDRLVDGLYEAALDPALWQPLWKETAEWLGAMSGALYVEDRSNNDMHPLAFPGWPEKARHLYLAHYNTVDPYARFGRETALGFKAILGQEIISAADYERSEIWNDLGRHYMGAYHFLVANIPIDGQCAAKIGFHRARGAAPFN